MDRDGAAALAERGTDDSGIEIEADGHRALAERGTDDSGIEILDDTDLARHVRTPEGVKKYHLPIGSLIVDHDYVPHPRSKKPKEKSKPKTKKPWEYGAWADANLSPGDEIPNSKEMPREVVMDYAPLGTSIVVEPMWAGKPGPREVWTKVPNTDGRGQHWESVDAGGSTRIAQNARSITGAKGDTTKYRVPPSFGGDLDKVLHPKDGDEIQYRNDFDEEPTWTTYVFDTKTGKFVPPPGFNNFELTPRFILNQLSVMGDKIHVGKEKAGTDDYLFWAADADRLDAEFRVPVETPRGWVQATPREAFPKDIAMALGYYNRAARSTALRLFKGRHDEVAVVDDVGSAKYLSQFLEGIGEALDIVADAPSIKSPKARSRKLGSGAFQTRDEYLTFTVGEEWDEQGTALAYVRNTVPDDVQINPALVNGTYDGGDPSVHAITPAVKPYRSMLSRLTAYKAYYHYKNSGEKGDWWKEKQNWWGPAVGMVTQNIFTATLAHELGHVNDGRHLDTSNGTFDADPKGVAFWKAHQDLSQYGETNAAEGYAEAFAEWFAEQRLTPEQRAQIPSEIRSIAAAYAVQYGWADWDAQLMVKE